MHPYHSKASSAIFLMLSVTCWKASSGISHNIPGDLFCIFNQPPHSMVIIHAVPRNIIYTEVDPSSYQCSWARYESLILSSMAALISNVSAISYHDLGSMWQSNMAIIIWFAPDTSLGLIRLMQKIGWHPQYVLFWPENLPEFQSTVEHLSRHFPLNSNVYWVRCNSSTGEWSLWESYSIKSTSILKHVTNLSTQECESKADLLSNLTKFKWVRRQNFRKEAVVATAPYDKAYAYDVKFHREKSSGVKTLASGFGVETYRIFRDLLNFTEEAVEGEYMDERLTYGTPRMDILLRNGCADISISESTITARKLQLVTFLHDRAPSRLEVRFPRQEKTSWRFFARPFHHKLWLLLTIYAVIKTITAHFCRDLKPALVTNESDSTSVDDLGFVWVVGTISQQGWHLWPKIASVRAVFLVTSMAAMILYIAYTGKMTSQLALPTITAVTLEDLLVRNFTFYIEEDVGFPFDDTSDVKIKTIATTRDSLSAALNATHEKAAYVLYPEYFAYTMRKANYTDEEACELHEVIKLKSSMGLDSMAVNKTSEFKEIFNILTLLTREVGIATRLFVRNFYGLSLNCPADSRHSTPQSMTELLLPYTVLATGAAMSLTLLSLEIALSKGIIKAFVPYPL